MRRLLAFTLPAYCLVAVAIAASLGSGSATPAIQASFRNAYYRGSFSFYADLPTTDVRALGSPGLVQELPSRDAPTQKYALIKPDPAAPISSSDVLQVYSDIYAPYVSLGAGTVGYPTNDTTACPAAAFGVCRYQLFTKNYAIFAYSSPVTAVFSVRDPYYSIWQDQGGIGGPLGVVTSAETPVTSLALVSGTRQDFSGGTIFAYPAGAATPSAYSISGANYTLWNSGGTLPVLGFPTSGTVTLANGTIRQTFESGRIEQQPGLLPVVLFSVAKVEIQVPPSASIMTPGGSLELGTSVLDTQGQPVTGRVLTWSTTNGAVVRVTGHGDTATVQAVAVGTANLQVTTEGITSLPITIRVGGPCCVVGEGAPSPAAFQTALDRNRLVPALPVAAAVSRIPGGYRQTVSAAGNSYVISMAEGTSTAYLNTGALYEAFLASGGFSGQLGFPVTDPLPGGVQRYSSGAALGGLPVQLVPAPIAAKWFELGTGQLGPPLASAVPFKSLLNTSGVSQVFTSGVVFSLASGRVFVSSGTILARYLALAGTVGVLGAPASDILNNGGTFRQDFETGYLDLSPGASVAAEHFYPRRPSVLAAPTTVVPGGRVSIRTTGFSPGANLNITITGQPPFSVRAATGAFLWDMQIPLTARAGDVQVRVTAAGSTDNAAATYTISPAALLLPKLTMLSGDQQYGVPGARLAAPVVALLQDSAGAPLAGVPVKWTLSPGATVEGPAATDANGQISGLIRLPLVSGVAVGSLNAAGKVVVFSALASAKTIPGFPGYTQMDSHGGLVAALAALLRYQQDAGLGASSGLASVATLSAWLAAHNGYVAADPASPVANPWVAAQFAGAGISLEVASVERIRDLVAAGTPTAVVLALQADGAASGSVTVNAIGVAPDGAILISDPDPLGGRPSLSDYLTGFFSQGRTLKGTISAVFRFTPVPPAASGFTIASPLPAGASAGSVYGACAALDVGEPAVPGGVRYHFCDGTQASYELDLAPLRGAALLDLAPGRALAVAANTQGAWQINRRDGILTVVPQSPAITTVTDAATFATSVAPGSLISIFGAALAGNGAVPVVTLGGRPLQVIPATPFQVNAVVPGDMPTGNAALQLVLPAGTATYSLSVSATAPAVFAVGAPVAGLARGAILNQDGTVNGTTQPAGRGQFISIYCTGLGRTIVRDGLQVAFAPVSVVIGTSAPVNATFAGAVAGYPGLYQVNVQVPPGTPPAEAAALVLVQAGITSPAVGVSIQ